MAWPRAICKIRDAAGKEGGFTARYSIGGTLKLERVEKDINYQYIRDRFNWPKELLAAKEPPKGSPPDNLADQSVTWEGTVESPTRRACTSSSSTAAATSRCTPTASWCSIAGGRTGTPGTTTSS